MDRVDVLGEDGAPYFVEHKGQKYRMSRLIGRVKAQWELFLRTRALDYLRDMKGLLPDDMYAKEAVEYKDKLHHGGYSWGAEESRKLLETEEGSFKLAHFCFLEYHPELDEAEFLDIFIGQHEAIQRGLEAMMAPALELAKKNAQREQGKMRKTWGLK